VSARHDGRDGRGRSERGAASIFVLGMAVVLLVCAGLVIDGGLAINARMRIADDAEQAARVGADSIDVDALRNGGDLVINEVEAESRAASYLQARGYGAGEYSVLPQGNSVVVTISDTSDTALLQLVGISTFDINARATSTPETGP
jgi:Flp pilus assembly protein TadG